MGAAPMTEGSRGHVSPLRRVDARFLLPRFPTTARTSLPAWEEGLRQADVPLLPRGTSEPPELVVVAANERRAARPHAASMLLVEGTRGGLLPQRRVAHERRYLPLPDPAAPQLVVELSQRKPAALAVGAWNPAGTRMGAVKHRAGRALLHAGVFPPMRTLYAVRADASGNVPALVALAAGRLGMQLGAWYLVAERGPDDKRLAFFLVPPGTARAEAVVKFSRIPHERTKNDRESRGLLAAHRAGRTVSEHAPRLLGRAAVAGHHANIESVAPGRTLGRLLLGPWPTSQKLAALDGVARWLATVARSTRRERAVVDRALLDAVASSSLDRTVTATLVETARTTPAVLEHGDLAGHNVLVADGNFTAIDWELANADGYPLWDVLYLALYCLPLVAGTRDDETTLRYLRRLFRGEEQDSPRLFGWLHAVADAAGVPPEAVPRLVTLGLLWYADVRVRLVSEHGTPLLRFQRTWLSDPDLGLAWPAWRRVTDGASGSPRQADDIRS
jgi:hypothetical protein